MLAIRVAGAWGRQRLRRFADREAIERHQRARLRRLLPYVTAHAPFYRERVGDTSPAGLAAMTPIDKMSMMAAFDTFNTRGIRFEDAWRLAIAAEESRDFSPRLGDVTVGLSSGTSGHRGLFLVSDAERAAWAGTILARLLPGPLPGVPRQRIAFFLRANSNLYESMGSRLVRFAYFDILDPLESHLARLQALRPTVLVGPPSVLRTLASFREDGALAIAPERVVSVAEVLEDLDEAAIRRAFGTTVHQVYQATEGLLATTCRFGTLHLAEDLVRFDLEPLGGDPRRVVPVVTDLFRTTQPIIRYRLNDVLVLRDTPCLCGSALTALERIDGRSDDVFLVKAWDGRLRLLYPDFVRRAVMAADPGIRAYRVRQRGYADLEVWLDVAAQRTNAVARVRDALAQAYRSQGALPPTITPVERFETAPGRKLRRIERAFTPDPADVPPAWRGLV